MINATAVTRRAPSGDRTAAASFVPTTYNGKARTVDVVLSTFAPVARPGMVEVLDPTPAAWNVSRADAGVVPVLDSHNPGSVDHVLGQLLGPRFEPGQLVGTIAFADTPRGRNAEVRVASGELRAVSIGYRVGTWTYDGEDPAGRDIFRASDIELLEVSLVSVPADPKALVRNHPQPPTNLKGTPSMSSEPDTTTAAPAPSATRAAIRAETHRVKEIMAIGERYQLTEEAAAAVDAHTTLDEFRSTVLNDHLAPRSPAAMLKPGAGTFGIVDAGESPLARRDAMVDGIIMRAMGFAPDGTAGQPKVGNAERSREFANMSILEMAAQTLGIRTGMGSNKPAVYEEVVTRTMLGTSDFPLLLTAAANKFLLAQYQYQAPSYRAFSAKRNFNDFKAHSFLRVGDFPVLEQLTETGEFRNGALSESREQVSALTYGKIVSLSRQMFVNDDLSAFSDLTSAAGRRVADFENSVAWSIILANSKAGPTMSDTGALFNTTAVTTAGGHANQAGTAAAISIASVNSGFVAMSQQKSLDSIPLNLKPTYLVCGPAKRLEAMQLLSSNLLATQISNVNPFAANGDMSLKLATDAYITDNAWYLFADPMAAPSFVYGYVSGFEGPRFAIDQPFRQDGLSLKVVEDFGFGAIDWRGAYRNAGA